MAVDKYILAMFLLKLLFRLSFNRRGGYGCIAHRAEALTGYSTNVDVSPYPHRAMMLTIDTLDGSFGCSKCRSILGLARMFPLPRDVG